MTENIPKVEEMEILMHEIIKSSECSLSEEQKIEEYFNDFYNFINTKIYKYGIDDNGFVIRKDKRADKKSIYGWDFKNGVPTALNTKIDIKKNKQGLTNKNSVYAKIYEKLGLNLKEWLAKD